MSAEDNLSEKLFHGTHAAIKPGGLIEPRAFGKAYASNTYRDSAHYASSRSFLQKQMVLFNPVYEVEPLEGDTPKVEETNMRNKEDQRYITHYTSERGFRVKGVAGWEST